MANPTLTNEVMQKRVDKIEALFPKYENKQAAIKAAGYAFSEYYRWKKKLADAPAKEGVTIVKHNAAKKQKVKAAPAAKAKLKVIFASGSAEEVLAIMKGAFDEK